jgi:UDPglucose 6-dehydrogenase
MKVCVYGLWHLGAVTATCLANAGHEVIGLDLDADAISRLNQGQLPVFEPGLEDALRTAIATGKIRFTTDLAEATKDAQIVWVSFDTPVDDDDRADIEHVVSRVTLLLPHIRPDSLVLVSSQLPVGTTRRLERMQHALPASPLVTFAYVPENLRLGKAIEAFTRPDRFVVGLREQSDKAKVLELLSPFTDRFEWMSVESAEMTKHAINAFLATSVVFINEIASICEKTGADAKEVERGLKSEGRIGPKAYLSPGSAFAGGTLARDITFLNDLGALHHIRTDLFRAVLSSNDGHRGWIQNHLQAAFGNLSGRSVTVWGLSYKVGTDTLRRSSSIELCSWLIEQGATVHAHDPVVRSLPPNLAQHVRLHTDVLNSIADAEAVVVATGWPEYAKLDLEQLAMKNSGLAVFDPNRVLANIVGADPRFRYFAVGKMTS